MSMHFSWRWCWLFVVGFVAEARLDSVFLASSVVLNQQQIQMVGATVREVITVLFNYFFKNTT